MMKLKKRCVLAGMTAMLVTAGMTVSVQNVLAAGPDPVLSPERPSEIPVAEGGETFEPNTEEMSPQTGDVTIDMGSLAVIFSFGAAALFCAGNYNSRKKRQMDK